MTNIIHTKVDPEKLIAIANNVGESIIQIENAIKVIRQTLTEGGGNSLIATWTGAASNKFYALYEADAEQIDSMLQVLQSLNEQLKEAAGVFDSADKRALELVKQLKFEEGF